MTKTTSLLRGYPVVVLLPALLLVAAPAWAQGIGAPPPRSTALEPGELQPRSRATAPGELPPPAPAPRDHFKLTFWLTLAATAALATGTAITGATLWNLEDQKVDLILDYRRRAGVSDVFYGDDICAEAQGRPDAGEIRDWCSEGERLQTATYVLGTLAIVGAAASAALLLYRAYFHESFHSEPRPMAAARPLQWTLAPAVGPRGGGVGLMLHF